MKAKKGTKNQNGKNRPKSTFANFIPAKNPKDMGENSYEDKSLFDADGKLKPMTKIENFKFERK